MDLIFLLVAILDGMIVGMFVAALVRRFLGDSPFARLLRLIFSAGFGIGYFLLCGHLGWGDSSASDIVCILVFFIPVGCIGILKIIDYMFDK